MTRDTFKAKGNPMPSNEQREAIGDEKVVAWFSVSGYGGSVFVSEDRACVESWIEHRNADQDRRGVSEGYRSKGPFSLIPHSAYAELAAELDRRKSASLGLSEYARVAEARAEKAESQLAELRGIADRLRDALQFYADKGHFNLADEDAWDTVSGEPPNFWCDEAGTATIEDGYIARFTLAAADGGG